MPTLSLPNVSIDNWKDYDTRKKLLLSLPDRVWKLLNCEIAQSVQHIWIAKYPNDDRPQKAIDTRRAWCLCPTTITIIDDAYAAYAADAYAAYAAAADAAAYSAANWRYSYYLYLASRPVEWSAEWNTDTAIALARCIWDGDFSVFPILADALQDAGCDNEELLSRLRDDSPKCRADVSVCSLLGIGN